jgi:hypothetical protein
MPLGTLVGVAALLDLRAETAAGVVGHSMAGSVALLGAHHQPLSDADAAHFAARSPLVRYPSVN